MSDFSFPWSKKKTPQELAKEAKRETKYVLPDIWTEISYFFLAATILHEQMS